MHKLNWKPVARILVSAGLLAWLGFIIDWPAMALVWRHLDPNWILAAVVWIVISILVSVPKWGLVLASLGIHLSYGELWRAYWAGLFFNNLLPSSIGGDALRIWWAGQSSGDHPGAATSVITERILATTGLALTGLAGALLAVDPDRRAIGLFGLLVIISLALMGLIAWGKTPRWVQRSHRRSLSFLNDMAGHGGKFGRQWRRLITVGALSVVFQVAVVAVNYCIFRSLGVKTLPFEDLLYIVPFISAVSMLPVGINGFGLREGAYVLTLAAYQIPAATAVSASLIFVFLVSLCSLYGAYTWHNRRRKGDIDVELQSRSDSQTRDALRP